MSERGGRDRGCTRTDAVLEEVRELGVAVGHMVARLAVFFACPRDNVRDVGAVCVAGDGQRYPRAMMTSASAERDLLMCAVSCAAAPVALESARHSEPARSTNDSLDRRSDAAPAARSSHVTWTVTMLRNPTIDTQKKERNKE